MQGVRVIRVCYAKGGAVVTIKMKHTTWHRMGAVVVFCHHGVHGVIVRV
jgi:hypothetical protein